MLHENGQEDKAAELQLDEGRPRDAIDLYLQCGRPAAAAAILVDTNNAQLAADVSLCSRVAEALLKAQIYDKAGELFEMMGRPDAALDNFSLGHDYAKAINVSCFNANFHNMVIIIMLQVARSSFPDKVIQLEEAWGDWLAGNGSHETAISHFLGLC